MAKIIGSGKYLPNNCLDNFFFEHRMDTSDEWIKKRTGINTRYISQDDEQPSDMGAIAAKKAVDNAQITPLDIDCIICTTSTPDTYMPATAMYIANKIGAKNTRIAYDINGVCNGYIYGMHAISHILNSNQIDCAMLVSTEKISTILDWDDRTTAPLFGDGSAAMLFQKSDKSMILGSYFNSNTQETEILNTCNANSTIYMNGKIVYKIAVQEMILTIQSLLKDACLSIEKIEYIILHQANIRIMQSVANHMGISMDKILITVDRYGNTSSASIPMCFDYYTKNGVIKKPSKIIFCGIGAGMSWGGLLVDYI